MGGVAEARSREGGAGSGVPAVSARAARRSRRVEPRARAVDDVGMVRVENRR
jgi:hypothetical protein